MAGEECFLYSLTCRHLCLNRSLLLLLTVKQVLSRGEAFSLCCKASYTVFEDSSSHPWGNCGGALQNTLGSAQIRSSQTRLCLFPVLAKRSELAPKASPAAKAEALSTPDRQKGLPFGDASLLSLQAAQGAVWEVMDVSCKCWEHAQRNRSNCTEMWVSDCVALIGCAAG